MLKPVIAATAILAIAGSSIVYAQQQFGGHRRFDGNGPRAEHRHQLSPEDRAAFADARIAALKAGLELTPDQAKNWPAFEQALRDMIALRTQSRQAREAADQQPPASPFDRMARRADNLSKTSAALKHIADAGAPLYMSLTDAQKSRFTMLARILRPHYRMHAHNESNGGWRHNWRRFGENEQGPNGRMHSLMGENGDGNQDSQL